MEPSHMDQISILTELKRSNQSQSQIKEIKIKAKASISPVFTNIDANYYVQLSIEI